jgi:protein-S-isoprenylcysteine O-methyltransferase Ste14
LMVIGFLVIFHNPWTYLIGVTAALISYKAIVTAEESYLRNKFGAVYRAYCDNVPRWTFRLNGVRDKLVDYRFSWTRVLLKDYSTAYATVVTILGILVYERLSLPAYADTRYNLVFIGSAFIIATIAFIVIYILKKRGILAIHDLATQE